MTNSNKEQTTPPAQQKGLKRDVLTPEKTPSWTFGTLITLLFVVLPLLILAGFYYGILEL